MIESGQIASDVSVALPVLDPAQRAVVENHDRYRNVLRSRGHQPVHSDREAAIAANRDDLPIPIDELRGERCRYCVAHTSDATGLKKRSRSFRLEVVRHENAVLARIARDDRVIRNRTLDLLDRALRQERRRVGTELRGVEMSKLLTRSQQPRPQVSLARL